MDTGLQFFIFAALVIGTLVVLYLNDRQKESFVREAEREGRKPESRNLNYKTTWGSVALVIICGSVAFYEMEHPKKFQQLMDWVLPSIQWGIAILLFLILAFGFIVRALGFIERMPNQVIFRALGIAQSGNVDGAMALMYELMQKKGPSAAIYNALATFLMMQEDWEEALEMIEKAENLKGQQTLTTANKGVILWKIGRNDEAKSCFEEVLSKTPKDFITTCNYGWLLVELGHDEEARGLLERADHLFATQTGFAGTDRQFREEALDKFREEVTNNRS